MSYRRISFSSKAQAVAEVENLRRLLAESERESAKMKAALVECATYLDALVGARLVTGPSIDARRSAVRAALAQEPAR